ncbi:ATP-binding protein [Prevotella sp.]|uniref:ATP-binding protein n=1 Tax=Prevotella sp. TaxID=59823 RepID=UPI00308010C3
MTKTTNNSFSVKALVAKYRNFVMENTPCTSKKEGDAVVSMCDPYASSADIQLISQVYKDVLGDKADQKVLDIMSKYINCFCKNALTNAEYVFLCENFSEFIDYEFINKKSWAYDSVMTAETQDIVISPVFDLSTVAGVPAETLRFLSTHCAISKDESFFVSGDDCGDIKSLFAINDDALHSYSKEESWALNTIRFCMRSTGARLTKGIPAEHTQDVVVFFDYDYDEELLSLLEIKRDVYANGSDKKVLLVDAFKMLKSNGRMYLDIARAQLKKGSGIYSDIQKFVSEKLVTSVSTYKFLHGQYRCLLVIDKRGADKITMKAEMAEKSVDVSYDDVDMDMLWPGYYYNKRQANTIPLSELVELYVPKAESSEKGATVTHFVLSRSLEDDFMNSCLSDADLYMAEKAMKRLRIEKTEEAKTENFSYSDEDFVRMENTLIERMRRIPPCTAPCVLLSSLSRIGYVQNVPADGICVFPLLYCLKTKQDVSAQYVAALLCDDDIKLQIRRTCEDVLGNLDYVLDKIYVPNHTPIERERYVTSVVMSAYDNLKKEKEQDLTNYSKGIRLRKHALSQSLSSVSSLFDTLNTLRKRNFGTLDDTDVVSVKGFTVADIFERLEKWLPEVMETVDHLADIDYSFGKIESINPETFIEGYISSHDKEWMNFSASVNWIRGNNIAREDIKMNGVVLLKKGNPISSFNFPKDALYRILDNIVSNAKEYAFTDEGREDYDLHFSWRMNGTDLVIEIANNGTPIPEDRDVRSLLEYGVSSNLHSRGHNGIGCHEIKGIMNRYNGDFEIVSKPQDKYTVRYLLVFKSTNTLYTL